MNASSRLLYIDLLRGLVIVHMALDHVWELMGEGRMSAEFYFDAPESPASWAHFITRFTGIVVAPAFCFLAGFSVAILVDKSREANPARRLLIRAGVLMLCQLILNLYLPQPVTYQGVLATLAAGIAAIALMHRFPVWTVGVLGTIIVVLHPLSMSGEGSGFLATTLYRGGTWGPLLVFYPVLPWLGIIMIGFATGRDELARGRPISHWLAVSAALLLVFLLIRLLGGYGNAYDHQGIGTLDFWIFAKYPPDLVFLCFALSQIYLMLALLKPCSGRLAESQLAPLLAFGQAPLFFYMLHFIVIGGLATLFGQLPFIYIFPLWLGVLLVLQPLCRRYAEVKINRPNLFTRYF